MQKRRHPKLKLSLLSCAIAVAVSGAASNAAAVDLCTGDASVSVSGISAGNNCTIDVVDTNLTVNAGARITDGVYSSVDGTRINNAGTINDLDGETAIYLDGVDLSRELTNSGTIKVDNSGSAYAVWIDGAATANIGNSGSMIAEGNGTYSSSAWALYVGGGASGNISNTGKIEADQYVTDSYAYAYGLYIENGDLDGNLNNSGRISANAVADDNYATATGLYISSDVNGDISNSGQILASGNASYDANASAVYIGGDVNGHIGNSGLIEGSAAASSASAYGLNINGELNGGLSNSGTIRAKAVSTGSWAYASALYIGGDVTSTINNSGLIEAFAQDRSSQASAYALYLSSDITSTGKLVNSGAIRAEAISYGDSASAYGIYSSGTTLDADFINSGVVSAEATSYGSSAYAYAVDFDEGMGPNGSIINIGTIKALAVAEDGGTATALALGGHTGLTGSGASVYASMFGNASIVNSGSIQADIYGRGGSVDAYGIDVSSDLRDNARILNTSTGTIRVTAESFTTSASITGIQTGALHEAASIVNNGRIVLTAIGHGDDANLVGIDTGSLNDDALIANNGLLDLTLRAGSDAYGQAISTSTLYNNAAIVNTGTISVDSYGLTSYASATGIETSDLYDAASIVNSGTIKLIADADGSATVYGVDAGSLYDTASIRNSGSIVARAISRRDQTASAYGLSMNGVFDDASVVNSGRIDLVADGRESASAYGIYSSSSVDGSISNTGSIKATASSLESEASVWGIYGGTMTDGSVSNSGSINVRADGYSSGFAYGIEVGSLNGASSVTNSGTITADATDFTSTASAYGIYTSTVAGTSTVTNSGRITLTADGLYEAYGYVYGIDVGSVQNDAVVSNTGMISAKATAAFSSASAWGINASTLSNNAEVSNSGLITISAVSDADQAYAYGMEVGSVNDAATVSNTGMINAVAEGQTSASAFGIYASSLNGTASVSNTGVIVASTLNHATESAYAMGIRVSGMNGTNAITNSGVIMATARNEGMSDGDDAYAYGIRASSMAGAASSITNSETIIAESSAAAPGGDAEAMGIRVENTFNGTITNTGKIVARNDGGTGTVAGIYVGSGTGGQVVNSGTIIGGVLLYGSTSLTNSGVIVSNSQQNLVGGNYTQQAGGELTLVLRDTSSYGLTVNGTADFSASNQVTLAVGPGATFEDGDVLTDALYAATLTAPLAGLDVKDASLFWNFDVTQDANGFDVVMEKVGTGNVLAAAGLSASGSQTDLVEAALTGELGDDYNALAVALSGATNAAALAKVVEQMGPALAGSASFAARTAGAGASNAISARMGESRGASSGDAFTQNAVWIKPFLGMASQDDANGMSGYDVDTTGFVIGMDGAVNDMVRLGVAVASAQSSTEGGSAELDIDTTQFTLYGSYVLGSATSLDADLSYGANGFDSTRRVGFANSTAVGSFDGTQIALGAKVSHRMKLSEKAALVPAVKLRYSMVDLDGYSETGAGVFNLNVAGSDDDAILLAAEAGYELTLANKGVFLANLGLGYDTIDQASATSTLSGNGPTFVSNGIEPDAMLVTGGLGYRYVTAKNLEINAAWDLESRSDFLANTLSVKFKLPF
ncbi:MAG: outer rane autotransporter [Moraxellaceae bacterium]|jgi:cytoskeletal protein CcmA (bactofilin family)|nr:outer rane autotransporter [Moraxellaceae bacterium]